MAEREWLQSHLQQTHCHVTIGRMHLLIRVQLLIPVTHRGLRLEHHLNNNKMLL